MKVAVVQCNGEKQKAPAQLRHIKHLISQAAKKGARLITCPEAVLGHFEPGVNGVFPRDPVLKEFADLTKQLKIWLQPGTFWELTSRRQKKPYNTAYFFNPQGKVIAKYRKRFLFDVILPSGKKIRESNQSQAGNKTVTCATSFGKVGFATCFDLRFPGHFIALNKKRRSDLIILPSNFTYETGKDHWLTLLKARAIENQVTILAPNQWGKQINSKKAYGHSAIIGPWGEILAEAPLTGDRILMANLDFQKQTAIRKKFPLQI